MLINPVPRPRPVPFKVHPTDPRHGTIRGLIRSMGFTDFDMSRPIIGVCNTPNEMNPGHWHFKELAQAVKRGIWAAGGFPVEFPTINMCEVFHDVSTLIYRNLMAIDTEEMVSSMPLSGVVMLSTCDKNVPAQLMAAATVNKPTIILTGGTRLGGTWKGEPVACATDSYRFAYEYDAGRITKEELHDIEMETMFNTCGACAVMGTANSVQAMAEALGMALPGSSMIPAVYAQRMHAAEASGRQIMELVKRDLRPSDILTRPAFENAIRVLMATGASTNLVIHMVAIARRAGIDLSLDDFDRISRQVPVLTNVKPVGYYTTEELYHAGGILAVMKELEPLLDTRVMTVSGSTLADNLKSRLAQVRDRKVIKSLAEPVQPPGGIRVLKGSLAPMGAIIKPSVATPRLLRHTGPAVVLPKPKPGEDIYALAEKTLAHITPDHVVINPYQGPVGGPGMPELGVVGLPTHLLKAGVKDVIRITDARMSGTAFGTCVLHCAPEAAVGGPLAAVRDGDLIKLDIDSGRIDLLIDDNEMQRRLAAWKPIETPWRTGFRSLWMDQCMQAPDGCDFRFNLDPDWRSKR